ncbi:cupin domain-containing protein [Litorivicinus lipolyticus]|uniref:cupin domain-containing protein n=1 Tax=Litorivicinus lipolyticus TaxID=418701 RepID=UPI003B5941E7
MSLTLPADFYANYWQKAPVWLAAATDVASLAPTPATLWDWAVDSHNARLIHPDHDFAVELEPTTPPAGRHTLLVGHIETHCPKLDAWARDLPALGRWRFADLMISHATQGASVGAHRDQYDVLLIQLSGQRRWDVGTTTDADLPEHNSGGSKLLNGFVADFSVTASPGDVLYIPPGCGHQGVALDDDCMTLSVGFRMPSTFDVIERLTELAPAPLLGDPARSQPPGTQLSDVAVRQQLLDWIQGADGHDLDLAFAMAATQLGGPDDPCDVSARMRFGPGIRAAWVDGEVVIQGEVFIGLTADDFKALDGLDGLATEGLSDEALDLIETFAEEGWLVSI